MYYFERSVLINCPIEKAFAFHSDTNNLTKISPSSVKVKIIKIDLPLKLNSVVELVVTQFGFFKSRWKVRLAEFEEYSIIGDLQMEGPFKYWYHRHCFEEENGLTKMTDKLEYDLPMGFLGKIAHTLFVRKMIEKQFEFRHSKTKEVLEK
jgi:ligand-binding SRPBCC domain-containing protein